MKLSDKLAAVDVDKTLSPDPITTAPPSGQAVASSHSAASRRASNSSWQASKLKVRELVLTEVGPKVSGLTPEKLASEVKAALDRIILREDVKVSPRERRAFAEEMISDTLGYGPLDPLLRDQSITEIMCNRFDDVWVERDGRLHHTGSAFNDDGHYRHVIEKIVGGVGR
ncbi:MAG: hypothetical protein LC749_16025, partial [Actinobacteria bacterium]|nr:hypothetical protein [Actinomycetota bacterium]